MQIAGKELGHADALGRVPLLNESTVLSGPAQIFMPEEAYPRFISYALVARATRNDPVLGNAVHSVMTGESLQAWPEWNPFNPRSTDLSLH